MNVRAISKNVRSIPKKLLLRHGAIILGIICAAFMIFTWYVHYIRTIEQSRVDQTVRESAIQSVALIQERLNKNIDYIESIAFYMEHQNEPIDSAELLAYIRDRNYTQKIFNTVTTATADGTLYNADGSILGNISSRPYFIRAMQGHTAISNIEKSLDHNDNIIAVAAPIRKNGQIIGIVNGRFLMAELTKYLSANFFDGRGYSYMANAAGKVFVMSDHPNADPNFTSIYDGFKPNPSISSQALEKMLHNMQTGQNGQIFYEWNKSKRTMSYMPIGINDWYLLSVLPNDIVSSRAMNFSKQVFLLTGLLILALLLLLSYINGQKRRNEKALTAAHHELLTVYNTIPGGVLKCLVDDGFTVIKANNGFYRFLGYTREMFEKLYDNEMVQIMHPDDVIRVKSSVTEKLKNGGNAINNEVRLIGADGAVKWVLLSGEAAHIPDRNDLIYYCFTDISELKRTQAKLRQVNRESSRLYNLVAGGIFRCTYDTAWTLLDANMGFYRLMGYTKEEFARIYHNELNRIIDPDDWLMIKDRLVTQLELGQPVINEYRVRCKNGLVKWILSTADLVEEEGKQSFYCSVMDISELKAAQEELRVTQQRYELIMAETQDIIFEWNPMYQTIEYSKNYEKKFGDPPLTEKFPQCMLDHQLIFKEDEEIFLDIYRKIVAGAKSSSGELRVKKADGNFLWCRVSTTAIRNRKEQVDRIIGIIEDIDHAKRELQKVKEIAQRDPLTGLYNKTTTERLIKGHLQDPSGAAAFLVLDIDDFKNINDTFGHISGDAALVEISGHLKSLFRTVDVVGRIGGDEFVVFLSGMGQRHDLERKLSDIAAAFQQSLQKKNFACSLSCSVGVALYPQDGTTFAELFKKADDALYLAKQYGKNQFVIYSER